MIVLRQILWAGLFCLVITACQGVQTNPILATPDQPGATPTAPVIQAAIPSVTVTPSPVPTEAVQVMPSETPDLGADDISGYYDGLVITLDHVGQTIGIIVGQGVLLRLGADFDWSVSVEPAEILTQNRKVTTVPGEQGVYIARKKGKVVLSAVGDPVCSKIDPPCSRPSVLFRITFDIK